MRNILPRLEGIAKGKGNLSILAQYLIDIDEGIEDLTVAKISEELFISIASGTRLAKKLGLSGFNELKFLLIQEKVNNVVESNKYDSLTKSKYLDSVNFSLESTANKVSDEIVFKVAELINNKSKINFYAMGGSYIVLSDFAYKISRLNKSTTIFNDFHFQNVAASNNDSDTLNIGLSYSGNTKEVLINLEQSKKNGGTTVLITNNENIDYDYIDYLVFIKSTENSKRLYSITSRFSSLLVLDLIYLSVINSDKDRYMDILNKTRIIK